MDAPLSRAADRMMLTIEAGRYIAGSTPEEREQAYSDYRDTSSRDTAREQQWFEREQDRHVETLPAFLIDQQTVTNVAYAEFVRDTGTPPPFIDADAWREQGFEHDYERVVKRFNWTMDAPPPEREDHPVVLVNWDQAKSYCAWRGTLVGKPRRLPSAAEFERAARGAHGRVYPWGNDFEPDKLESRVGGKGDTVAAGSHPEGASRQQGGGGMLDAAGNVAQWTTTPWPDDSGRMVVKGSAWDGFGGQGRGASLAGYRPGIRHVVIGFRCAADP